MEKKYNIEETHGNTLQEPVMPYSTNPSPASSLNLISQEDKLSINERKAEFIRIILNDIDDETFGNLEMILRALRNNKETLPYQYSVEELRERVLRGTQHIEEGKYYTDEELDDFVLG